MSQTRPARAARRPPARVDLSPAIPRRLHVSRCHGDRRPTCTIWASPTATPRPILKARPGSTHGYDIIDHGTLNPEIGTAEDYEPGSAHCTTTAWARSSTPCPTTWASARTTTPGGTTCSRTAPPRASPPTSTSPGESSPRPELHDKVLLPVLGDLYGDVLEAGQLRAGVARRGRFLDPLRRPPFPARPGQLYARILAIASKIWNRARATPGSGCSIEFQSILTAIRNLPGRSATDPSSWPSASVKRKSSRAGWRRSRHASDAARGHV